MNASQEIRVSPLRRAAIFVDFDNVYTGLRKLDEEAAEQFATDPGRWTEHLARASGEEVGRRFLIRNCYLNPSVYSKYRAQWTRAGYRVIDCPSLTQQGKSGTDINLVLDAVDLLSGASPIEEFILASADADFTSLIQRFRAADKMTTVVVAGAVASAYRLVADTVVSSDEFLSSLAFNGSAKSELEGMPTDQLTEKASVTTDHPSGDMASSAADRSATNEPSERPPIERQVSRVTGVPAISKDQFRQIFLSLEGQLKLNTHTNQNALAKQVRDDTGATDHPVSRAAVAFVIQGLIYSSFKFTPTVTALVLATASAKNSEALCRGARMEFTETERTEVMNWVSGGFLPSTDTTTAQALE